MNLLSLKVSFLLLVAILSVQLHAQVSLVRKGKSTSRIILSSHTPAEKTAAHLLQNFIQKMSGSFLPIYYNQTAQKGDVLISSYQKLPSVTANGFLLSTQYGILKISSTNDNGVIYGVVTLLEQYLGVDYWGENEYSFTPKKILPFRL